MVHWRRPSRACVLAIIALLGYGWLGYAGGNNPVIEGQAGPERVAYLRKTLDLPITFEFERGPFREAVAYLQDRYNLPMIVHPAFQKQGVDILGADVTVPKLVGVKLRTALRLLLEQLPAPAAIQIKDDLVWIVPRKPLGPEVVRRRPVSARFQNQSLTEALAQLAGSTECSIVVDLRAAEQAKTPVSAVFHQAPLEEAVFVLADMVGLRPVAVGPVLYVTTKENASDIQVQRDRLSAKKPKAAN